MELFEGLGGLRASFLEKPAPWRHQVYMTLALTHSALKPPGAKNCLDIILKKERKIKMMAVFFCIAYKKGFMRNPKLAPLLLTLHYGQSTVQYVFNVFYSRVFNDKFLTYFILAIRYVLYNSDYGRDPF